MSQYSYHNVPDEYNLLVLVMWAIVFVVMSFQVMMVHCAGTCYRMTTIS